MGNDGAHLGVTAGRALKTILGDMESPKPEEQTDRDAVEVRIRATPRPCEGIPIHERADIEDGYSMAADAIAHAFLLLLDDEPALFEAVELYPPDSALELRGTPRPLMDMLWDRAKVRWPGFSAWIGGPSGFQVGFAMNAVRCIKARPPEGNPAFMTIGEET
jgi:hypothetical protein